MIRRMFALCLLLAFAAAAPLAHRDYESFTIGVMNDQSGPYADLAGPGSVEMARMAIEDFGGAVLGKPIELLVADHQNKVDVGLAIARQWYDERGARAIFDITNSGVALAIQDLAKARDRIVILNSASSSDLTAKACSPNGVQWNADNWSTGRSDAAPDPAEARQLLLHHRRLRLRRFARGGCARRDRQGRRNRRRRGALAPQHRRFQLFSDCRPGIEGQGDRVRHHRRDLSNALKQANEFNLAPAQYLATPITYLSDVNALGLDVAHGLTFMQSWYWDLDDQTRAFAKRFYARRGRMPNDNQVALYSSIRHYLEAVAKAGTDDAGAVMKAMREAPIHDVFTANGTVRADGRVLYDRYLMKVKTPAESKTPWDYLTVVDKIPAADAFRPPGAGGCTLTTP